ncbi:MAG TPA: c-type cytochrome [Puia sp.]
MRKSIKIFLTIIVILIVAIAALGLYVKKALPNVGAPMDLQVQITPGRVEHGRYLANSVAACMVCHSQRDLSVFGEPVKAGTLGSGGELFGRDLGFPGNIYAANLTPYKLRKWSDGELFRAITTGVSRDGHALFPLMNYPAFGKLDPEDIMSIIAYLRTLPSITNEVPVRELDFPLSFIVNTIPAKAALAPKPDSNEVLSYGRYLVKMASCVECHSRVDKGKVIAGTEFGGGRDFSLGGGKALFSANITPDVETGIGSWDRQLFIRKFKQYADSGFAVRTLGKGEVGTPMPWFAYGSMREKDLAAIYAYLRSLAPIKNKVVH